MCEEILMKCGHVANGTTMDGKPYCVICNCGEMQEVKPSLEGRKAKCTWCGREILSDYNLPFFKNKPNEEYDGYYCGCGGWD